MEAEIAVGVVGRHVDDHRPSDLLRMFLGEGDGDGAAERVADHRGVAHPQPFQRLGNDLGLDLRRVAGGGLFRAAVAEQVDGDDPVPAFEHRQHPVPPVHCAAEAVDEDDRGARARAAFSDLHFAVGQVEDAAAGHGDVGALGLSVDHQGVDDEQHDEHQNDADPDRPPSPHGRSLP